MSTTEPSDEEKIPEIVIGGFKCANQHGLPGQFNPVNPGGPMGPVPLIGPPGSDFRRPEAYERMAADKPGEELDRDATIWKLYLEEAAEHDQELVEGRHKSLDMLLLFAALFSAILTAFLIESKNMLQADPQDTSVALLFQIAQSQIRMELGVSTPVDLKYPLTIPDFTPDLSAQWINGLWFTSLGLSLSAALIAMLSKEWLTAFLTSRPRPAHAHALLRQSRLEGLERWWALHIIALLPSLLHMSLLLFSVGLVVYLWTLDIAIAVVLGAIVGGTTLFYIITAVLGAVYDYCPFVTEISSYVRKAVVARFGRKHVQQGFSSREPFQKDLQALLWLANNARDPAVVDCSYQSLAGLQGSSQPNWLNEKSPAHASLDQVRLRTSKMPMEINPDTTIVSLLSTTLNRFNQLSADSFYLSSTSGVSMPRYINAISALSSHLLMRDHNLCEESGQDAAENSVRVTVIQGNNMPITTSQLLNLTNVLWSDDIRSLTPNTYASVLVSEHDLLQLVFTYMVKLHSPVAETLKTGLNSESTEHCILASSNGHVVDTISGGRCAIPEEELRDIRAAYSRWLVRVSSLLFFHSHGKVTIGIQLLESLASALDLAAQIDILNPLDAISTHHTQMDKPGCNAYRFTVPLNDDSSFTVEPTDLDVGPLASLIYLLSRRPSIRHGPLVQTCLAILTTYSRLAPVILQQVLGLPSRNDLIVAFNIDSWPHAPKSDIFGIRFICTCLMLLTLRYLGLSKTKHPSHMRFCFIVLNAGIQCVIEDQRLNNWSGSLRALGLHAGDLIPLLEFVDEDESIIRLLPREAKALLVNFSVLAPSPSSGNACETVLTPRCIPILLSMVPNSNTLLGNAGILLRGIMRRIQVHSLRLQSTPRDGNQPADYLEQFICSPKGFRALASAGFELTYKESVVHFAFDLTRVAAGKDRLTGDILVRLDAPAVPGFLDVIDLVTEYCLGKPQQKLNLVQFASHALILMRVACTDSDSKTLIAKDYACQALWYSLNELQDKSFTGELLSELRGFASELDIVLIEDEAEDEKKKHPSKETQEILSVEGELESGGEEGNGKAQGKEAELNTNKSNEDLAKATDEGPIGDALNTTQ